MTTSQSRVENPAVRSNEAGDLPGGRVPPQSLEAEMGVLGSMSLDRECISEIIPIVRAEQFYHQDNRLVFEALLQLYEDNKPVDLVLLRDELKRRGQLEAVGGVDYLVRLTESVPASTNAVYYAKIVRDKSMLRDLISISSEIGSIAYEERGDVADLMEEAEQKIFNVTQQQITGHPVALREVMTKTFEMIDQRSGSAISGLPSGYLELDELTSGLQRSEMIIVAARPSMGKTALGLNIAEHVGADNKTPVVVFSLEMAAQQLVERMLCGRGHIDSHKLRRGMLSDDEYNTLINHVAPELSEAPIFIDDSPFPSTAEIRHKSKRLQNEHGIDLIVVDYLQLVRSNGRFQNLVQEMSEISRSIKAVARDLHVPVLALSQLSRAVEMRTPKIPQLSDLRESGSIEQDADVVMFIYREDFYTTKDEWEKRTTEPYPENIADLIIAKHRNGPTARTHLFFRKTLTKFENLSAKGESPLL